MTEEKIHDALNLLDDDLISEVEWLRSRKKKRNLAWIPMTAAVACFSIFVISQYNVATESAGNDCSAESTITGSTNETPSVLLEITSWETEGFYGNVVQHVDTDIYPIGTTVYVKLEERLMVEDKIDAEAEMHRAEGMIVRVQFNGSEEGEQIILYAEDIEYIESK